MKLREILDLLIEGKTAISIETINPYKRSIKTYLEDYYGSRHELAIIPVFVTNACCNVLISGIYEVMEALEQYGENVQGYYQAEETGDWDLDTDGIETTLSYVQPFN